MRALLPLAMLLAAAPLAAQGPAPGSNPIIRDRFTADPAPVVVGDRLWLYTGHDEAADGEMFAMKEWLAYSTTDMRTWTFHGPIMNVADFTWASHDAWAAQVIEKHGRYWLYAAVEHDGTKPGKAIGVAVADRPEGPFVDAKGEALISNDMTPKGEHSWEDIDPTVFTDEDGTTWIAWGNRQCYIARLGADMVSIDGPITEITPAFRGRAVAPQAGRALLPHLCLAGPQRPHRRARLLCDRDRAAGAVDIPRRADRIGRGELHHPPRHRRVPGAVVSLPPQRRADHRGAAGRIGTPGGDGGTPDL